MNHTVRDFKEVYLKYAGRLYRYILKLCHDEVLAEDILSATFLKAIERSDTFQGNCELGTWLCRIAHNVCMDEFKKKEHKNVSMDEMDFHMPAGELAADIAEKVVRKEYARWWTEKILGLPEPYGEVFLLRTAGDRDFKTIGAAFGKSENWARVTYYRAKKKIYEMRKEMEGMEDEM